AAACSGSSHAVRPSTLITRSSLGGIRLGDSRKSVESMLGPGRVEHSQSGDTTVLYRRAGVTVFYGSADAGSSLSRLAAMPIMSCSAESRPQSCATRPQNGVPGPLFDATHGRVIARLARGAHQLS